MKNIILVWLSLFCGVAFAAKPKNTYVKISTDKGEMIVMLYNETPAYRDNFIKLAKDKFYNGTLFHRVIKGFMIQGGDPDSKGAAAGARLGSGDVGYKIPADFHPELYHKKGALAAARDNNPEKASSGCQFYIVQGKTYSDTELRMMETSKGVKYTDEQLQKYKNYGGTPFLDQNYTVFGEVVRGMEVIDAIADSQTDGNDRPKTDVVMKVEVLSKRKARKLEKELLQEAYKSKLIMK